METFAVIKQQEITCIRLTICLTFVPDDLEP